MPQRQRQGKAVAAVGALLLLPCSTLAWIPPLTTRHAATRTHAYVDDDSSSPSHAKSSRTKQTSQDYTGAGMLGDIMSNTSAESGLVTTDGGLLCKKFGIESPLDRMALTGTFRAMAR